jgi:hypothetical protein
MEPCNFLSHGSEEALRIEETSDPEHLRPAMITPPLELAISFQEFCVPKSKSCGEPRGLFPVFRYPDIIICYM